MIKFPRICYAAESGSGVAGDAGNNTSPSQNNQNNSNQGNNNSGSDTNTEQNNDGDFNLEKDNIWATDDSNSVNRNRGDNSGTQTDNNRTQQSDPMDGFNKFVQNKQFSFDIADEAKHAFQNGDWKGFQESFQNSARNMYREIMLDAGRMVNASVNSALEQAKNDTNNTLNVQSMRSTLQRIVPISKNSNVAPIAEAMMSQFVRKGQDHEMAAKNVQKVLVTMRNIKGSDLGINEPPRSNGYNNRNGRSVQMNDDDVDDIDWMSFAKSN